MASAASGEAINFHWADYAVFSTFLVISAAIGLFAAIKHRKASAEQLLTGNRKLPLFPVALSLSASFMSAIFVLGVPAEAYSNSTEYWLIGLGYIPSQLLTLFLFMPIFYNLKLTSAYQYLELRFNRLIRILGSLTFVLEMILYMAVVTYAPALALSQVTNLSMEISILATGLVCTLYTALGGIKAVVWTDTFQMLVILAGFLTLIVRGTLQVGGWEKVMERAKEGGRFTWDIDWDPNPFVRHTFWTLVFGGMMTSLTVYSANQTLLQRYLIVRNIQTARWVIALHLLFAEFFLAMAMITGLVMYAFYYGCDPLKQGVVSKGDQLMALFVMQTLGEVPGLAGLFVACIYSAALSTVSSGVNSLAAVTLEDFLRPWLKKLTEGRTNHRLYSIVTIFSAVLYGLMTIGLAYLAGFMGPKVLQISLSIFGMVGGPLLGLLIVGIFFPCVNAWGAGIGLLFSLAISFWVGVGATFYSKPALSSLPPLTTHLCNVTEHFDVNTSYASGTTTSLYTEFSMNTSIETPVLLTDNSLMGTWYRLSYQHYATVSVLISIIVGLIVSAATGFNSNQELDGRTYYDVLGLCKRRNPRNDQQTELIECNGSVPLRSDRL